MSPRHRFLCGTLYEDLINFILLKLNYKNRENNFCFVFFFLPQIAMLKLELKLPTYVCILACKL